MTNSHIKMRIGPCKSAHPSRLSRTIFFRSPPGVSPICWKSTSNKVTSGQPILPLIETKDRAFYGHHVEVYWTVAMYTCCTCIVEQIMSICNRLVSSHLIFTFQFWVHSDAKRFEISSVGHCDGKSLLPSTYWSMGSYAFISDRAV
jgi:hypothetical protein